MLTVIVDEREKIMKFDQQWLVALADGNESFREKIMTASEELMRA